jgi:hypothetical protein
MSTFKKFLLTENGNVESAFTLVPLMLLFLSVLQLGIGVYGRIASQQLLQGSVARSAFGQSQSDEFMQGLTSFSPLSSQPLPGGGSIDMESSQSSLPSITPLLIGGDLIKSSGLAVQE